MTRGSDASSPERCAYAIKPQKNTDVNILVFTCVYTIFARLLIFTSMFYDAALAVLFQSSKIYNAYCQLNFNSVLCAFISSSFCNITYSLILVKISIIYSQQNQTKL